MAGRIGITVILDGVNAVQNQLMRLGNQFDSFGSQLRSTGTDLSMYLTAPLLGVGGAAVKVSADLETSRIGFTTMLGSAEAAGNYLDDLAAFAASTPFEFMELQATSKRLMAMGISADQVIPVLTGVGDAISAMGGSKSDLDRALLAISQIKAKGKAMGEEMTRQLGQVIPAWDMLATALGVSVAEAMELVEKGAVNADLTIAALLSESQKRFPGMMQAMMSTTTGLLSNLKDVVTYALATLGDAITETFKLKEKLQNLIELIAVWKKEFNELDPILKETVLIVAGLAAALGPVLVALSILPTVIGAVVKGFGLIMTATGAVTIAIAALVAAGVWLAANWNEVQAYAQLAWGKIFDVIYMAVEGIVDSIEWLLDKAMSVAEHLPDAFGGATIKKALMEARDAIHGVGESASEARKNIAAGSASIEKDLEDNVIASMKKTSATTRDAVDAFGLFNTSADAIKDNTKAIEKVFSDLNKQLDNNVTLSQVMGGEYDLAENNIKAMQKALEALVDKGVDPTSQSFLTLSNDLKDARLDKVYDDLSKSLRQIDKDSEALGDEFDKNKALMDAYSDALSHLYRMDLPETRDAELALKRALEEVKRESDSLKDQHNRNNVLMRQGVEGVTDAVKMLWSDTAVELDDVWKGALNTFVDNLIVMEIQANTTSVSIQASMAAATAGISFFVGLIAMAFGGGEKEAGGKSRIEQATDAFLDNLRQTLDAYENEVLSTLDKLARHKEFAGASVHTLGSLITSYTTTYNDIMNRYSGTVRDVLLGSITGAFTTAILDHLSEVKDAIIEEWKLRKQIAEDTIELYRRQQDYMRSMDDTITDVERALLTPQEMFAAQQGDISRLQDALMAATGDDRIRILDQLRDAFVALWDTAQGLFGEDVSELARWQEFVVEGLRGVKEAGIDYYQELIDINREMLGVSTSELDVISQMNNYMSVMAGDIGYLLSLLEAIGQGHVGNIYPLMEALAGFFGLNVPAMAEGGIITKPTYALMGEAGPEAIIPLNRAAMLGGVSVNNTFAGPVIWDDISASKYARKQADAITKELRRFDRA